MPLRAASRRNHLDKEPVYLMSWFRASAADVAAADLAEQDLTGAVSKFIADDIATSEAHQKRRTQEMIDARTHELLFAFGS